MATTPLLLTPYQTAVVSLLVGREKGYWIDKRARAGIERAALLRRPTAADPESGVAAELASIDRELAHCEKRIAALEGILRQLDPEDRPRPMAAELGLGRLVELE